MEVKGTAVRSVPEFVQKHFPLRYQEWLNSMPESSKKMMMRKNKRKKFP